MTRQHFEAIAETLSLRLQELEEASETRPSNAIAHHMETVRALAQTFARFNGRFDIDRFITAATRRRKA